MEQNNWGKIRSLWNKIKNRVIKVSFTLVILFLILIQFFQPLQNYIITKEYFGVAILLTMMLIIFDAITTSENGTMTDKSIVLDHFSEINNYLKIAFEKSNIKIDILAYSGETFYSIFTNTFQSISKKDLNTKTINLRILIPDCSLPMGVPCNMETKEEDEEFKKNMIDKSLHFSVEFQEYFEKIKKMNSNLKAKVEIRKHPLSPLFKYISINEELMFFSIYPISETLFARKDKSKVKLWDYRGVDSKFIGLSKKTNSEKELFVNLTSWYDTVWYNLSNKAEG